MRSQQFPRSSHRTGSDGDKKKRLGEVLVQHWVPPLISGCIGVAGGFLAAHLTWESTEKKIYLELRMKHADETARQFAKYWINWSRMTILCRHRDKRAAEADAAANAGKLTKQDIEKNKKLFEDRTAHLMKLASERNAARDALYGSLGSVRLYFSDKVITRVSEFEQWDQQYVSAECKELPDHMEWNAHEKAILELIRAEIAPTNVFTRSE